MKKIAADQFHDPAFGVLANNLNRMPALAEFLKEAELGSENVDTLPDTAFAWPEERRFPIHTAEHAALSFSYTKTASVPAIVTARIQEALDVYSVPARLFDEVKVAAATVEKDYLLPALQLIPVNTKEEVKLAQQTLVEQFSRLDLESRAEACANLVKKADVFGVTLNPVIEKLAGLVVSRTDVTRGWLEARANVLPDGTYKLAYQRLSDGLKSAPAEIRDRSSLIKLASAVGELDSKSGLDRHYDRKLPDALQTVFNTSKLAAETVDVAGALVPVSKLAALPASFWEDVGGPELSREIAPGGVVDANKLAEVVDTLPLDLKMVVRKQLRA